MSEAPDSPSRTTPAPLGARGALSAQRKSHGPEGPGFWRASVVARYAMLVGLSALFLLPFLWMLGTSLTPADQVLSRTRSFFPTHPEWSNYAEALGTLPFALFLKNTLLVAVL